jgi:NAD(P)-dependent dehydrogenase (short-subunit alcohol dehydrogenase family)
MERHVLVTGVSRGLGAVLVKTLRGHGCIVDGLGQTPEAALPPEVRGCLRRYVRMDLAELVRLGPDAPALAQVPLEADAVVNNAAIRAFRPLHQWTWSDVERVVGINYLAAMRITHLLLPGMLARNFGRIINIASKAGIHPSVNGTIYNSSKAALVSFTECLARDLAETGRDVTANVICPGSFVGGRGALRSDSQKLVARIAARVVRTLDSRDNARVYLEAPPVQRARVALVELRRALAHATGLAIP